MNQAGKRQDALTWRRLQTTCAHAGLHGGIVAVQLRKLSAQQPFQARDAGRIGIALGRIVVHRKNASRFDGIELFSELSDGRNAPGLQQQIFAALQMNLDGLDLYGPTFRL